jgi:SAM-dependent methyltransferase
MTSTDLTDLNERKRTSFDAVAQQYDDARPAYPEQLIDAVMSFAGLQAGARALEIGAGTGQATLQFAWRGIAIDAIEPGAAMADFLRDKFDGTGLPVTVQTSDLESAVIEPGAYDLVYAPTSWHWLTPRLRWRLVAEALKPGGTVAALWHVPHWRRTELRSQLDPVYEASGADLTQMGPMVEINIENAKLLQDWVSDVHDVSVFTDFGSAETRWSMTYDAEGYAALLGTYGDHLALADDVRERLLSGVAAVVEANGGTIELFYTTHLMVARAAAAQADVVVDAAAA